MEPVGGFATLRGDCRNHGLTVTLGQMASSPTCSGKCHPVNKGGAGRVLVLPGRGVAVDEGQTGVNTLDKGLKLWP